MNRISARPTLNAQGFHIGIVGQNFDPKHLLSVQKFIEFIHEQTGRTDLIFNEIRMLTYWKLVHTFIEVQEAHSPMCRPKMRMVNKFSEGRIFITGDAAHVHSPTGGQGLNTSVQDSVRTTRPLALQSTCPDPSSQFNLGWKLALAYKGHAAPGLLASYHTERLPVVTHMLIATSSLYNNMLPRKPEDANPNDLQKDTKPDSEDGATKSDYVQWRNRSLQMLEINYRWSPAVYDVRGTLGLGDEELKARAYEGYPDGDVRAGDRAPSAPGLIDAAGVETTLFDLFKSWRHTVLVFTPGTEEAGAKVASIMAALHALPDGAAKVVVLGRHAVPKAVEGAEVYHDTAGRASRAYHVDEATVSAFAVRPDGYLGAFVHDAEELQKYFSKVFRLGA